MKEIISLLFIGMVLFQSCIEPDQKPNELEFTFSELWEADSLGCNGSRIKIVEDSLAVLKQCKGRVIHEVFSSLGIPNTMYKRNESFVLSYFVTCSQVPEDKLSTNEELSPKINSQSTQLIIETDTGLIVKDVRIVLP